MTNEEIDQLNRYHQIILNNVAPLLEELKDSLALKWLQEQCKPIISSE